MNKIKQNLIKYVIRNWTISLNYSTVQNHTKFAQDSLIVKNTVENNVVLVNSIKNIIESNTTDNEKINEKTAIKIINAICEELHTNMNIKDYTNYPILMNLKEFEYVCTVIQKNARFLSTYNTIKILKLLLFLKVPSDSMLIQTLLQLISVSLNDLSIGQIMILYNLLYKIERTPLSKALLIALPKAFKFQAEFQLESDSTNLLEALKFCSVINDTETKMHIIRILFKNKKIMDLNCALEVFYAIYTLPVLCPSSKQFLSSLQNRIKTNCKNLDFNQVEYLLYCISKKFVNLEIDFYIESLVDDLCYVALSSNTTFKNNLIILKHLNKMRHSNIPLLNHLVKSCIEDTNVLEKCTTDHINWFINSFIIADYKSHYWEDISKLLQNFIINTDYTVHDLISITFRLLSLNCYSPELIEKVFSLCNKEFIIIKEQNTMLTMLKLYWCIKLLYPQYKGVNLDENILNQIKIEHESYNKHYLMESLKETVGGFEYMKSGLKTKLGRFVDNVIVVQSDESFMNISNYNVTFVEELASLSKCSKILFFVFPTEIYSINNGNMLSTITMELKAIETLSGFYTVAINSHLWKNFSDKNRVLYLRKAIKSKCINIPNK